MSNTVVLNSKAATDCKRNNNKVSASSMGTYVEKIQLKGRSQYQDLETTSFNPIQQQLYAEAVYGLHHFSEQEKSIMSPSRRMKILNRFNKAQRILNMWKQQIVGDHVDALFSALFPKSPVTRAFLATKGHDRSLHNDCTFKELNLSQKMVASKLVEFKILPENFFSL